eukprot:1366128-Amphidinium_carterae.1
MVVTGSRPDLIIVVNTMLTLCLRTPQWSIGAEKHSVNECNPCVWCVCEVIVPRIIAKLGNILSLGMCGHSSISKWTRLYGFCKAEGQHWGRDLQHLLNSSGPAKPCTDDPFSQ